MSERDIYLNDEQYRKALDNAERGIAEGVPLVADDDTTPGNKSTSCTWGLCSDEKRIWSDEDMKMFPDDPPSMTRPKYRGPTHRCPMDRRFPENAITGDKTNYGQSCFFHCRVFNPEKVEIEGKRRRVKVPSKDFALALYAEVRRDAGWRAELRYRAEFLNVIMDTGHLLDGVRAYGRPVETVLNEYHGERDFGLIFQEVSNEEKQRWIDICNDLQIGIDIEEEAGSRLRVFTKEVSRG